MSAKMNLDEMSYKDLMDIQDEITEAMKIARAKEVEALRAEMKGRADRRGLTLEDLFTRARRQSHVKAPAKFVGPEGQTWSGRGRRPLWFKADEAQRLPVRQPRHSATA